MDVVKNSEEVSSIQCLQGPHSNSETLRSVRSEVSLLNSTKKLEHNRELTKKSKINEVAKQNEDSRH